MKCQHCAKTATMQITEILDESRFEELTLCDDCGFKYLDSVTPKKKKAGDHPAPLSPYEKRCDQCGLKFVDFRNTGRLGCPHDYDAFKSEIVPLLESIHNGVRHAGKIPHSSGNPAHVERVLTDLRKELQEAIVAENYEEAAQLRDRIRVLERTS